MKNLIIVLNEHLPLIIIVGLYIAAGFCVQFGFQIDEMMNIRFSYKLLNIFSIFFSCIFLIIQILRKKFNAYINPRNILGLLLVIALAAPFMSTFSSFKQVIPIINNFTWDYPFMKLDYILHFGHHPWEILRYILNYPYIIKVIDLLYMLWFPILLFSCLWMGWSSRRKLRLQFFINTCVAWVMLGTFLAIIFSSAGPCYYTKVVNNHPNPYEPLMTRLINIHESIPLFAIKNQIGIWEAYQNHVWLPFGGISAMPSLHIAITVLLALVGWRINHYAGILLTAYAFITQIGAVILGWHYAVDGYVSILLTILIWKLVNKHFPAFN
ncbi:phosphatase PAP2 family protein [bacterium]|nr:phosphatase PAP2 family protein [bacterium]